MCVHDKVLYKSTLTFTLPYLTMRPCYQDCLHTDLVNSKRWLAGRQADIGSVRELA